MNLTFRNFLPFCCYSIDQNSILFGNEEYTVFVVDVEEEKFKNLPGINLIIEKHGEYITWLYYFDNCVYIDEKFDLYIDEYVTDFIFKTQYKQEKVQIKKMKIENY